MLKLTNLVLEMLLALLCVRGTLFHGNISIWDNMHMFQLSGGSRNGDYGDGIWSHTNEKCCLRGYKGVLVGGSN